MKKVYAFFVLFSILFFGKNSNAQVDIILGNGTSYNFNTSYPAPYGNWYWGVKHQILIQSSELTAAGMVAGFINSLSFHNFLASGVTNTGFTISLKSTSVNALTDFDNTGGFTVFYGPANYADITGVNLHVFGQSFYWDGVSNILVETCFNNSSYVNNAQMYYTTTSFNSVVYYNQDAAGVCAVQNGYVSPNRPNMTISYIPDSLPPVVQFSVDDTINCTGTVQFLDQTVGLQDTHFWTFGDGATSNLENPTHTYAAIGTYTISQIVTNQYGADTLIKINYVQVVGPIISFGSDNTLTCSGIINFFANSACNITSWLWDFGDGTTSNAQNPSHIYSIYGQFDVSLTACNSYGCSTLFQPNYIFYDSLGVSTPDCQPQTLNYCCSAGIYNVSLNTMSNTSLDGSEGYQDYTCNFGTNVYNGSMYAFSVETNSTSPENVRAWIDFNSDGHFNDPFERVFESINITGTHAGTVYIPTTVTLNIPLRLRVISDAYGLPVPAPCDDIQFGQAEDYAVTILENTNPPDCDFVADHLISCDGIVHFTDQTLNNPAGWLWNFGDGTFSNQINPIHNYLSSGTYTVTLIAVNNYGQDTIIKTAYIEVNLNSLPVPASCIPYTSAFCCRYGIVSVIMAGVTNNSPDASVSYEDYACEVQFTITEAYPAPVTIATGPDNPEDVTIWIDLDNNGIIDPVAEKMFYSVNEYIHTGIIYVPSNSAVFNTPLRMRISSDYTGSGLLPCTSPLRGQAEDYTVIIEENILAPICDFEATPTIACDGPVQFVDLTLNSVANWQWDFGDGTFSGLQNPLHFYLNPGTYSVKLVVSNSYGSDSLTKTNYILVQVTCAFNMPVTGQTTVTSCEGTIYDDGGPNQNYSLSSNSILTIAPPGASQITVTFPSNINYENFLDYLYIYDGPSTSSPLIDSYTGFVLPNGGTITSTGGAITFQQITDAFGSLYGFEADFTCIQGSTAGFAVDWSLSDQCNLTYQFIDQSIAADSLLWDFGDGTTSNNQNPIHTYDHATVDDTISVTLTAFNGVGSDQFTMEIPVEAAVARFEPDNYIIYMDQGGDVLFTDESFADINYWSWNFGDGGTALVQSPLHIYADDGAYSVTLYVENDDCQDSIAKTVYVWNNTGVHELDNELHVNVYPNPTEGNVHISIAEDVSDGVDISVFNIFGQLLFVKNGIVENEISFDFSNYSRGVYYLKMVIDNRLQTQKIIIQ